MALAEPSRWAMVRLLAERPRSVGEVAAAVGLSLAVTSRHLQRLRAARLVVAQRRGKNLSCALAGSDSAAGQWLAAALGIRDAGPHSSPAVAAPAPVALARRRPLTRPEPAGRPKREMDDFLL